jgi:hypothetical protein
MPRLKSGLPAIALAALFAFTPAAAQSSGDVSVEANCQPATLGAVALGAMGLELAGQAEDDRGFVVERWTAPAGQPPGWATVLLMLDGQGAPHRCLLLHRLPDLGEPS